MSSQRSRYRDEAASLPALEATGIRLFYLPSYNPEFSDIEPVWQVVKHNEMLVRRRTDLKTMKHYIDHTLEYRADALKAKYAKTTNLLHTAA